MLKQVSIYAENKKGTMQVITAQSVILKQRVHPFPFRTRKLSSVMPKILDWQRSGKIGHGEHGHINDVPELFSSFF